MADIKKRTAIISMLVLGILSIIFAIQSFVIDLTGSTFGIVGLGIGFILITEIGLKRLTKLSKIKELQPQQQVSLIVASIVLVTSMGLLFGIDIPILSDIAKGSFLTGGIFVVLEALTF